MGKQVIGRGKPVRFTLRVDEGVVKELELLYAWEKRQAVHGARYSKSQRHGNAGYLSFNMWLNKILGDYLHKQKSVLEALREMATRAAALTKEDLERLKSGGSDDV